MKQKFIAATSISLFQLAIAVCTALFAHAQPYSDLFISEYVEGGSNNKAIEIYNPTSDSVSLTGYKLQLFPMAQPPLTLR